LFYKGEEIWMNKTFFLSLILGITLLIAACAAPTPTPLAAAPAASTPQRGGKLTMVVWQSPVTLNSLLGTQKVMYEVLNFVAEGFTEVLPDGRRVPNLAKEVPTSENGGVSADGKTITYHLKENLKWSDGTPLTCADVQFTLEAILTPNVGVTATTGYKEIDQIECPSPQTVVIQLKTFYAPYLTLFSQTILPKHYAGDPKGMKNWDYNRKPLGTGPFVVEEWKTDEYIRLKRNANYRQEGKPYLDEIIIRIVPSSEAALQLLTGGEADIMWNNTAADLPALAKLPNVKVSQALQSGSERLWLNLAENKDKSDPSKPHAILGDVRVRRAIAYGINKQRIVDTLLFGNAKLGTSELNAGFFECQNIPPYPHDPTQAKKVLDEAGWKLSSDGIRAKDGNKLRLKIATTSGNKLREDTEVLIAEDMKAIGVELFIENAPSSVVLGTWDGGSPRRRGNYDLVLGFNNLLIDPHAQMVSYWSSAQIPGEKNTGGANFTRFNDPKADELLQKASIEIDLNQRKNFYCQLAQLTYEQVNMIYLYQRYDLHSYRADLQGWQANAWQNVGWNAEEWKLK